MLHKMTEKGLCCTNLKLIGAYTSFKARRNLDLRNDKTAIQTCNFADDITSVILLANHPATANELDLSHPLVYQRPSRQCHLASYCHLKAMKPTVKLDS